MSRVKSGMGFIEERLEAFWDKDIWMGGSDD